MLLVALCCLVAAAVLLAVAVTTGSLVWSWLSLAASGLAALVLVLRWVRRVRAERRAARAGEDGTAEAAGDSPDPEHDDPGDLDREPDEEDTDAADVLVVAERTDEVVVLDERPRYHLRRCRWLGGREIVALGVGEARDLGFTPCARCGPDAVIARRHRAEKARARGG